jgi:hypothetical protein
MEKQPAESPQKPASLSSRARRTLELVYDVEGVGAARVWMWAGRAAVAVKGVGGVPSPDLLRRVEAAIIGLREAGETWEFGFLQDTDSSS